MSSTPDGIEGGRGDELRFGQEKRERLRSGVRKARKRIGHRNPIT